MKIITPLQSAILQHLATFRFLSAQQLTNLGVANHVQTVHKNLRILQTEKRPLLKKLNFGVLPTKGKLPDIFYLTQHGAEAVAELERVDVAEIHTPKNQTEYGSDYFHRTSTIDFYILLWRFCQAFDVEIDFLIPYYHFIGANHSKNSDTPKRTALNRVSLEDGKFCILDGVFKLIDPNGKQWVFGLEVHKNFDTKRAVQTIKKYAQAITQGSINTQFEYLQKIPLLMVCDTPEAMQSIQERLQALPEFQHLEPYIFFKYQEQLCIQDSKAKKSLLIKAFAQGWQTFTGKAVQLF